MLLLLFSIKKSISIIEAPQKYFYNCCRELLDLSGSEAHELSAFMSSVGSREVGTSNRRWHTWRTDQAACFSFCEMTFPFSS